MGKTSQGTPWNICPTCWQLPYSGKPLFCLPHEGEGKQTELDASWCDISNDDSVTQLKEVLKVSVCVLTWQTTKLVCLHHRDKASAQLKVSSPNVDSGPNRHIGNSGGRVVAKWIGQTIVVDGTGVNNLTAGGVAEEEARDLFFLRSVSGLSR
jgi:hypothetical protein